MGTICWFVSEVDVGIDSRQHSDRLLPAFIRFVAPLSGPVPNRPVVSLSTVVVYVTGATASAGSKPALGFVQLVFVQSSAPPVVPNVACSSTCSTPGVAPIVQPAAPFVWSSDAAYVLR